MEKRVLIYSLIGLLVLAGLIFAFSGNSKSSSSNSSSTSNYQNSEAQTLGSPTYSCLIKEVTIGETTIKKSMCSQLYSTSTPAMVESVKKSCELMASAYKKDPPAVWSTNPCPEEDLIKICDKSSSSGGYKDYMYEQSLADTC